VIRGGEYHSLNTGINHRITCPYTHQQAGAIERRHRQIVEVGLALLAHSNLPQMFWEDAFLTAVFIINRLPTPILNHKSPYEMVHHQKPDYNFLRTFGCACWPYLHPYNRHKLDFRSKNCIFIGYIGYRGYKCLVSPHAEFLFPVMLSLMKISIHTPHLNHSILHQILLLLRYHPISIYLLQVPLFCRCHSTIYCIKHSAYGLFIWSST